MKKKKKRRMMMVRSEREEVQERNKDHWREKKAARLSYVEKEEYEDNRKQSSLDS